MSSYLPLLVTLTDRRQLTDSFLRITLRGDELASVSPTMLDQRVKLVLAPQDDLHTLIAADDWFGGWRAMLAGGRGVMRTYTLSGRRPELCEVDIDVVVHTDAPGPASTWASSAPIGSSAVLVAACAPRAGHQTDGVAWRPGSATEVLVVADETALVAASMIAGSLDQAVTGRIIVEVPHAGDRRELQAPAGVEVLWAVRDDGAQAHDLLPFAVSSTREEDDSEPLLWSEGEGKDSYLWVAGEAAWVRSIRTAARAAGVTREASAFMGYWRLGHAEM